MRDLLMPRHVPTKWERSRGWALLGVPAPVIGAIPTQVALVPSTEDALDEWPSERAPQATWFLHLRPQGEAYLRQGLECLE